MLIFFKEYIYILLITGMYGLIGGFSIIPLRSNLKYPILAAPMAGILLSSMGVFILYSFAGLSVITSIKLLGTAASIVTMASLYFVKPKWSMQNSALIISIVLILAAIVTLLLNFNSIKLNDISLLFMDGSDHLGYAAMADWLNAHLVTEPPIASSVIPYQSFPALLIGCDPRFGSFFTLAIISSILGKSSTFTYDIACSIILLAGYLGIASVFCRSAKTLILLLCSLVICIWFILALTGYFGKILGLPSAIFILGLYLIQQNFGSQNNGNRLALSSTLILTFGAAMSYPGHVLSLFLMTGGGLFLGCRIIEIAISFKTNKLAVFAENAVFLLLMILIGFAASGLLSQPKHITGTADFSLSWLATILTQLDVRYLVYGSIFNWESYHTSEVFLILAITITIIGLCIALIKKNIIAISLIGAAVIFLFVPFCLGNKWAAYQLSGTLFPLLACGFAWMIDDVKLTCKNNKIWVLILLCLMIFAILIRLPSFIESVHRFTRLVLPSMRYSNSEMSDLAEAMGAHQVIVDIPYVMFALPILVEMGRQNKNLEWTPQSWKAILGYRDWHPPPIHPSKHILGLTPDVLTVLGYISILPKGCDVIKKTRQYQLLSCDSLINKAEIPLTYRSIKVT